MRNCWETLLGVQSKHQDKEMHKSRDE